MQEQAQGYRGLLRIPAARRLAIASIPADFADWLDYAAILSLLVFVRGVDAPVLAWFAVALSLPYILVGPLLAPLIDRTSLRTVLVITNLARGAATMLLVWLPDTVWVLAIVFLRGSVDSAFSPARQAAIQATTPAEMLPAANGLHQAINQSSKIVGPALGGLLSATIPLNLVFMANAALSVLAAAVAWSLRLPPQDETSDSGGSFWSDAGAGIAEFAGNPRLLAALIFACFSFFSFFLYDALIALMTADLGLGPEVFGFSIAGSGAGGLVGALLAGRYSSSHLVFWMSVASIFGGVGIILFAAAALSGMPFSAPVFVLVFALMGASSGAMLIPYRTILQQETPPGRMARVSAAGEAATTVAIVTAPFLGSVLASAFSTAAAFLCGGILRLLIGITTPWWPGLRRRG